MRTASATGPCAFIFASLLTAAAAAGEPPLHKVDLLLQRLAAHHGYLASPGYAPIIPPFLVERDAAALPLLVVTHDPDRAADAVAALGGRVHARAGRVLSVTLALGSVEALLQSYTPGR